MTKPIQRQETHCPICGQIYSDTPALSRTDNKTAICPDCGIRQSLDSIGVPEMEQDDIIQIIHNHINK